MKHRRSLLDAAAAPMYRRAPAQPPAHLRGRIDQYLVDRSSTVDETAPVAACKFKQVVRFESGAMRQPIVSRSFARALDQRRTSLQSNYAPHARGQRQSEVAETAEKVGNRIRRVRCQQAQHARNQDFVDAVIDLCKVSRQKR